MRLRHLMADLRAKDLDLARLLEEKMRLLAALLAVLGTPDPMVDTAPDYTSIVREKEEHTAKQDILDVLQVNRWA